MRGRLTLPGTFRRVEVPLVVAAFFALRGLGVIANVPWWAMAPVLLFAGLLSDLANRLWPDPRTAPALWLRTAMVAAGITTVMYTTGWGPTLAIGYAWLVGEAIGWAGSRACRPVLVCSLACLLVGQIAIAVGVAPSLIDTPDVHGLALLCAIGLVFAVGVVERSKRAEEKAEDDLRRREERFRAMLENAADVIVVFDAQGTASYASPSFERLIGARPPGSFALPDDLVHPGDRDRALQLFQELLADPGQPGWAELRLRDERGAWHWFEVWCTNRIDDPDVRGIVANLRDVTERKEAEEQLTHQAHHDTLTGLPNRLAFLEELDSALRDPSHRQLPLAVLFLDIDRFKLVNDSLGHEVGDRLLVEVAERMRTSMRPGDVVSRLGGDEFTILLADLHSVDDALRTADRALELLRRPIGVAGRELVVTGSIGIAVAPAGEEVDAGDLLRRADLAMYLAKDRGRARSEVFDARYEPAVENRLELEGALWRAVEEGELVVYYQPEVSLVTGEVVAVEALVRWNHPERGLLLPNAFVPFAEESSLIVAIDRYVLRAACEQLQALQRAQGGTSLAVSVNLSPRFVQQRDVVDDIVGVLYATGVEPWMLQLEITERTALADRGRTHETLRRLREHGIHVAVDDFGTGYSSLGYLRQLPVDVLKLDRSFVQAMGERQTASIVEAVITMGHALGLRITAEGVERPAQVSELRALGCDTAQGFHFARPLDRGAVEEFLAGGVRPGAAVVPLRRLG